MERIYKGKQLDRIGFPMGGLGAGMLCLEGTGALAQISIRNAPNVSFEPNIFAALHICGEHPNTRVLEAPVPTFKIMRSPDGGMMGAGNGLVGKNYGLPRFNGEAEFQSKFPFANIKLVEETIPLNVSLTGWSPFIPGDEDRSGMPFAAVEYRFENPTDEQISAVFSFNAFNFMGLDDDAWVEKREDGFILRQPGSKESPWKEGAFYAFVDERAKVDAAWFRGGWWDPFTMLWNQVEKGDMPDRCFEDGGKSVGGALSIPFTVKPHESEVIRLKMCWYVPNSEMRFGADLDDSKETYRPWYSEKYASVEAVHDTIVLEYDSLYADSKKFNECFAQMTLGSEVQEAVEANLAILKSPTILRQYDGRMWAWEGCCDTVGSCIGSCTHVWNYAQAICHLFPRLERSLRQTEFHESQNEEGHQQFRASLPIRTSAHDFHAASDGQLGGIMKVYRDFKILGDVEWLKDIWPQVKQSIHYCIETWDPNHEGVLREPHHNTYDIEFWGPDPMCTSFYLGALRAMVLMAEVIGEDGSEYDVLYQKGRAFMENELFNGEYFEQQVQWKGLRATLNPENDFPETAELLRTEGPKYQYGIGCLSDGVLGAWMAEVCGIGEILSHDKVLSHLRSIYRYNFRENLRNHSNPQRPGYALGEDGGLLLCSWPHGKKPSLPFVYSDEVWTGIEYQVASHLMLMGENELGRKIVKTLRARYDGTVRNPFDEYECGHWYARAMASYALIQSCTGLSLDEEKHILYYRETGKDYQAFLAGEHGWGLAGIKNGKPFAEAVYGELQVNKTAKVI